MIGIDEPAFGQLALLRLYSPHSAPPFVFPLLVKHRLHLTSGREGEFGYTDARFGDVSSMLNLGARES